MNLLWGREQLSVPLDQIVTLQEIPIGLQELILILPKIPNLFPWPRDSILPSLPKVIPQDDPKNSLPKSLGSSDPSLVWWQTLIPYILSLFVALPIFL